MESSAAADASATEALAFAHPALRTWFEGAFPAPTDAQARAWPAIDRGRHTLLLAPTGSGKTLAAFLVAINRLMFAPDDGQERTRVLYVSPLKALGVDVERNLRAPLVGIEAVARREGAGSRVPRVGVRSGDTPNSERQRLVRHPPDILITTPESLYLMLTSRARETLVDVDTIIIDEIHSMVPSKRGAHLFVSLERLEALRRAEDPERPPAQRIGLSATQRPLDEIARLLGGAEVELGVEGAVRPRSVEIVDVGSTKHLELTVEVPVEDMAKLGQPQEDLIASGPAARGPVRPSIWPSIHPRLVELVRAHRTTMIFCNSRRLAERLAHALNELADEEIAAAHHGSIAKDQRLIIEDRLKRGELPAIIATSSLELGIDMGAVDLVIQIEAPPSVASGMQRIGRAGHQVGAVSEGIFFPKYRGDLLASAAVTERMHQGAVEATYYPRNPLDVLAQQLVAMVSLAPVSIDALYATVRAAAPFAELPRSAFEGTLDLLSGRFPSDEFAELRPRVTWDRVKGEISPRRGTQRTAVMNAGTIPDRGLYGVFLANAETGGSKRVGELDEEMVFESRVGDVFLLGASSWRITEITHDRVLVVPAPGEPGRMPFWHGDRPGRPLELGRAIGALARTLRSEPAEAGVRRLEQTHGLETQAAENLLAYLDEQAEATGEVPSDQAIVVERFRDEVGDWRVCILSPFGARVHAPWGNAVRGRLRRETSGEVDLIWSDDGLVFRLPETDDPPESAQFFPAPEEIEDLVVRELGNTALFAAHFRENAGRALLLPKRNPQKRMPLWVQRKRAADLLAVASKYPDFPIVLETYRECLRDVFDLGGLQELLRDVQTRAVRVRTVDTDRASPFAASLLFAYAGNFIYDADSSLAERKAQTLALDHAQLRELLGDAELRELLDADVVDEVGLQLQRLDGTAPARHIDAVHELLLRLGDLSREEIAARAPDERRAEVSGWIDELLQTRRIIEVRIGGEVRLGAAEDGARFRDALGVVLPMGLPDAFLTPVADPLGDLVARYARTHGPFRVEDVATRLGLGAWPVREILGRLESEERVLEGEFTPRQRGREWVDAEVLRRIKRRSLARLRKQIEPTHQRALARFMPRWHGVTRPRRGLDGLLDTIEQLQGAAIPASVLEKEVLPARVVEYHPGMLDELCAAGEIVWRGVESLGANDGRVALYLTEAAPLLARPSRSVDNPIADKISDLLGERGAQFFDAIARHIGGFPQEGLDALWDLVWAGQVTNDTFAPVRALLRGGSGSASSRRGTRDRRGRPYRSRRQSLPGAQGRWALVGGRTDVDPTSTERLTALAQQFLERHGVLTREAVGAEGFTGGFSTVYPVLKAMEEAGRIRRGYYVAGLGATQFAVPGAEDRLRERVVEEDPEAREVVVLASTDPANVYGAAVPWPAREGAHPQRAARARVILEDGVLFGYLGRSGKNLTTFFPDDPAGRRRAENVLVDALCSLATAREPFILAAVDGVEPERSPLAETLRGAGFTPSSRGWLRRRSIRDD